MVLIPQAGDAGGGPAGGPGGLAELLGALGGAEPAAGGPDGGAMDVSALLDEVTTLLRRLSDAPEVDPQETLAVEKMITDLQKIVADRDRDRQQVLGSGAGERVLRRAG